MGAKPSGCWPQGPTPRLPPRRTAADLAPGPKGQPGAVGRSGRPGRAQEEAGHREPLQACQPPWPRGSDTGTSPTPHLIPPDSSLMTSTPERTASPQPQGLCSQCCQMPQRALCGQAHRVGTSSAFPPAPPPRTAAEPEGPRTVPVGRLPRSPPRVGGSSGQTGGPAENGRGAGSAEDTGAGRLTHCLGGSKQPQGGASLAVQGLGRCVCTAGTGVPYR